MRDFTALNIELDKTRGLKSALAIIRYLATAEFDPIIGCMPGNSLVIAPASLPPCIIFIVTWAAGFYAAQL
ncbi:hypothetical protein HY29_03905 [Hyphomonas beringensis]|uniref:Uncharacterized protein n=1 Tax=Hyphomonas beringensis TaxID=1280946 RepID=A0A062TZ67_9PROT|nr:hypothetical protein HY29_03905 [Hyphomonas beringensis]